MEYKKPVLRHLGSLASLTLGEGGSCYDGAGRNITQTGGGAIGGEGDVECGPGTGGST